MAGILSRILTLGIGVYLGIYADQHYQVPKVDDPQAILEKVTEWMEQYKRDKPKGD